MKSLWLALALLCLTLRLEAAPAPPRVAPGEAAFTARFVALFKAMRYAEAEQLLQARLKVEKNPDETRKIRISLFDVHFLWAQQLEANYDLNGAIAHYMAAYENDKTFRRRYAALALNRIGLAYRKLGQQEKAVHFNNQALLLYRQLKDRGGEAITLTNIGAAYDGLGQFAKALDSYNLALAICRETKDLRIEAVLLANIGQVHNNLSQYQKALEFHNQALPIQRKIKDRQGEAATLNSIGIAYDNLGQSAKALKFYNLRLPLVRQLKDRASEAITLTNIGLAHSNLGQYPKALQFHNQALRLVRETKNRRHEAAILNSIGATYRNRGQLEKALEFYNLALPLRREVKDRSGEWVTLNNLMFVFRAQKQPELAILCGKQAVNILQSIRRDNQGLSKESKDAFLKGNEDTYRTLVRLLIEAGRFAEADEVLAMVQQDEFLDFVRRDSRGIRLETASAPLLGDEKLVVEEQNQQIESVVSLSREEAALAQQKNPTDAQTKRLARVQTLLQSEKSKLRAFFASMPERFKNSEGEVQTNKRTIKSLQPLLREMGGKVAHVWAFVDDKGLELLLTRPEGPTVNLSFAPDEKTLGGKTFRQWLYPQIKALNDAIERRQNVDVRARNLYNIVFCRGELQAQLEGTGINTLMWRLTGKLSEIPFAALRDRDGFLIEKYETVLLTAGSSDVNLAHVPRRDWRALGLGVSKARTVGGDSFSALAGVDGELRSIVNDPDGGFTTGVLPGRILQNEQFTAESFFAALEGRESAGLSPYQLVHIASHFKLSGDSLSSFLLTGDKEPLTMADLKARGEDNPLFPGVELMTLSACQTGDGGADSLGALAELNGAKAVIATLWPVADEQTAQLMGEFYRLHRDNPGKSKAWALRQAQLKQLKSGGKAAHPYFWAPFVLMGNAR